MSVTEDESSESLHVSIKPPPFMETAVNGWFSIFDAQFFLQTITSSQTKFYHVLAALPPDTISRLSPSTLQSKDFDELKNAVVDLYEKTKPELFEKLISTTTMTGRPSLFLSELRDIAAKVGVGDNLVRHKLLQDLPPTIGTVLGAQKELTLTQLGKLADELVPLDKVNCFAASTSASVNKDSFKKQESTSSLPTGLRPFHRDQRPKVCRAHLYFGRRARHCKPWCEWPSKSSNISMQPSSRASSPARSSTSSPTRSGN